jgi:hypothetical protein
MYAPIEHNDGPGWRRVRIRTNAEVTEEKEFAAVLNSSAKPSQAAEASSIGAGPAPRNMLKELISGGSTTIHHTEPPLSSTPMTEERPHGDARREIDRLGKFPVARTGRPAGSRASAWLIG